MNKKILIVGERESLNLGDVIICNTLHHFVEKEEKRKIDIIDISFAKNQKNRIFAKMRRLLTFFIPLPKFVQIVSYVYFYLTVPKNSSIIFAGGALFQDYFIDSMIVLLDVIEKKKCLCSFFSIGIGPLQPQNKEKLQKKINSTNTFYITMRDGLESLDLGKKIFWQPDIALCASIFYGNIKKSTKKIGWGCIHTTYILSNNKNSTVSEDEIIKGIVQNIKGLISHGYEIDLFCNGDYADYEMSKVIYTKLNSSSVHLQKRPTTDLELVSIISSCSGIIASRLHALILAYSYEIPMVAFSWDTKVDSFLKSIGHENNLYNVEQLKCKIDSKIIENLNTPINQNQLLSKYQKQVLDAVHYIVKGNTV